MSLHDYDRIKDRLKSVADPVGFLTNLFAHSPVAFGVWSADGTALLTNQAFMDIFQSEPPPDYNVLKDDILAKNGMLALFQKAFAGETVQVPTFWYDPRELTSVHVTAGRRVAISMTIFPLLKPTGEIDYVAATYKDETEIMLALEAVKQSEEGLRITLNSIGDAVIATDAKGQVTRMNPVGEQLTGWPVEQALGKKLSDVFNLRSETTGEPVENPVERVLREGKVVGLANHTELVSRDGTRRSIADSGAPIRDDTGELRGVVMVFQDQTEQRQAEQVLQRSEARFRRLAESGIIGIITTDVRGNILEANDSFLRMVGYSKEEVLSGQVRWADMTPPEWRHLDERAIAELTKTGIATPWEKEYLRKDGSRVPILVGVAMIDSASGDCIAFILDLSMLKKAEAAAAEADSLRRAKQATDEANAELEAFSYSVAHDLRAPLRGLSGFSSILLEDYAEKLDRKGKDYLARIGASASRMSHIIDALLSLARLTRTEVRRESVDLTSMAHMIIAQLQTAEPERAVDFQVDAGLTTVGDPELLQALLSNLLGNAWKFTSKRNPGRIEFRREPGAGTETFLVRDNGAGFDMNHVDKLFTPFRRLHTSEQFDGSGIGLAIVQRIVRRHGGRIWAEGAENQGATFRFTLFHEGKQENQA